MQHAAWFEGFGSSTSARTLGVDAAFMHGLRSLGASGVGASA